MLQATRYIKRLSSTDTKEEKIAILREAAVNGCRDLFVGFQIAFDRMRHLGVEKVPVIEGDFTPVELADDPGEFGIKNFMGLIKNLEAGKIPPSRHKDQFHKICEVVCIDDWNLFYRPILLKKFRLGVTEREINAMLEPFGSDARAYLIPIWKMQKPSLASDHPKQLKGTMYVEPMVDGTRCIIVMKGETVKFFTDTGQPQSMDPTIRSGLAEISKMLPLPIVLDSWIVSASLANLISPNRADPDHIAVTDILALEDFQQGGTKMTLEDRHAGLVEMADLFADHTDRRVYIIPKMKCDVVAERGKVEEFFGEIKAAGMDAILVKGANSVWEGKKTNKWLEWKL